MRSRTLQRTAPRGLAAAGVIALGLALSVGGAFAGSGKPNSGKHLGQVAAAQCAKDRKALGNDQFKQLYGKPAMPHCIGVTKPEVSDAFKNAAKECKAERDDPAFPESHDGKSFTEFYGTNGNKKNAFGKCVSGKAKSKLRQDREDTVNAAQACKAEQQDPAFADSHDGKSFSEFYGTNKNGKNAYGKCVSAKVKESGEDQPV